MHQYVFAGTTAMLMIDPEDILITYAYLYPNNIPSQIMVQ
jgi:hypothetical protein